MKKFLSLVLSLLMVLSCTFAVAEEIPTTEIEVESLGGSIMAFEDLGIQLTIPEVLAQTAIPEENASMGIFDCYAVADGSAMMMLGANKVESEESITALITTLQAQESISDIGVVSINGVSWLHYASTADNLQMYCTDIGNILLTVYTSPADDEDFQSAVLCILGTVTEIAK